MNMTRLEQFNVKHFPQITKLSVAKYWLMLANKTELAGL